MISWDVQSPAYVGMLLPTTMMISMNMGLIHVGLMTSARADALSRRDCLASRSRLPGPRDCARVHSKSEHAPPIQCLSSCFGEDLSDSAHSSSKFASVYSCVSSSQQSQSAACYITRHLLGRRNGAEAGHSWVCEVFSDYARVRRHHFVLSTSQSRC